MRGEEISHLLTLWHSVQAQPYSMGQTLLKVGCSIPQPSSDWPAFLHQIHVVSSIFFGLYKIIFSSGVNGIVASYSPNR